MRGPLGRVGQVTLVSASKRCLPLLRERAQDGVCPSSWVNGGVWVSQPQTLSISSSRRTTLL